VISGRELYAGVCWSKDAAGKFLPMAAGFVVVLDENNKVIAAPGAHPPEYENGKLKPLLRLEDVFEHAHDVCVLENGDLIVCQWNAFQTYPIRLERLERI
jgi:peptidylglycine monooxygenase